MTLATFVRDAFPRVYRRKLHAYCVGAAKTGTTSVASMFSPAFRSSHEHDIQDFNRQLIAYLEQQQPREAMRAYLAERDRRLNLDIESSHPMGYVSDLLVELFPQARFIVTVREPLSWLKSRLNFHHKIDPVEWREYRAYFWTGRHRAHPAQEATLARYDLCSLDVYLSQYADHYRRVLADVPEARRLIVRTSDLVRDIPRMADFLGVDPGRIQASHSNREDDKIQPLDDIDPDHVRRVIWAHCEPLIRRFFPETLALYPQAQP